jgi:thiamine pyrophosphokinase
VGREGVGGLTGGGRAVVFVNGEYEDDGFYRRLFAGADLTIAADGGARFLLRAGLLPDVLVGDFDSLDEPQVETLAAAGVRVVRHAVRKDFTDTEAALVEAAAWGAGEVVLAGALGGGLDHLLGNVAALRGAARRGCAARIAAPHLTLDVLTAPASMALTAPVGARFSVIALSDEAVVSLAGGDYPLERGVVSAAGCLGIGNVVARRPASVELHAGEIAVLVFGEPVV